MIVYLSVVFLAYLYFDLLNKSTRDHAQFTSLVSQYAIDRCEKERDSSYDGQPIFIVPTYNESPDVVDAAIRPVLEVGYRVLMIDDGSVDHVSQTCDVADEP